MDGFKLQEIFLERLRFNVKTQKIYRQDNIFRKMKIIGLYNQNFKKYLYKMMTSAITQKIYRYDNILK